MNNKLYIKYIASKMGVKDWQVEHCVNLLQEGATVPFISRYRKEATGELDEVKVAEIRYWYLKFIDLDKRKETILLSIKEQDKLTPELESDINNCVDSQLLEDLYLPYKPKRRTRASIAKEKGYLPLAEEMLTLKVKRLPAEEEALSGARDIIAEVISDNSTIRGAIRDFYIKSGEILSKVVSGKEEEGEKYANYFNYTDNLYRALSFRILAVLRGEQEGFLSVKVAVDKEIAIKIIRKYLYKGERCSSFKLYEQMEMAIEDSYKRLIHPSIEREVLKIAKERADIESIKIFGENLRQLLLAAPVGEKRTLAIDPGFRTGCKVVCLDSNGKLLHNDTIYPHPPVSEKIVAMKKLSNMVQAYKIEVIAIGNGTAARETESFIKRLALPQDVKVFSVSEDGASIYSASSVAREEFPEYDVTVRGAVSIGRRLMDPLAELVKIEPKSLGVGQYQHDVDQQLLKEKLDDVVVSCVNSVGVNLNSASMHLLAYISGIGPALAKNIVEYRDANGPFKSREELLKVKRLGAKVYEQAAGFLRIVDGDNILDNSAVHPERYSLVEKMAADLNLTVDRLIGDKEVLSGINLDKYLSADVGMPTLKDILKELAKPGRDPRRLAKVFEFSKEIQHIEDVVAGMELPGIVTNITSFGAFVDIGIKQNGLIHISNISNNKVNSVLDVVKLHQHVMVKVIDVDYKRLRIQLKLI